MDDKTPQIITEGVKLDLLPSQHISYHDTNGVLFNCLVMCVWFQVSDFIHSLPGCEEQAKQFREEVEYETCPSHLTSSLHTLTFKRLEEAFSHNISSHLSQKNSFHITDDMISICTRDDLLMIN